MSLCIAVRRGAEAAKELVAAEDVRARAVQPECAIRDEGDLPVEVAVERTDSSRSERSRACSSGCRR